MIMYSRSFGKSPVVPPDYSGIAIKHHPPELPLTAPPPPPPVAEKTNGQLWNMLSALSAEDLLIYGVVIYMSMSGEENDMLLLILLVLVLI